ncbi:MAG: hypothetical protein HYU69_05055 [Bacteroidetes bacterium]|nr:hypothetical protein [Bacteroidota bacterium]
MRSTKTISFILVLWVCLQSINAQVQRLASVSKSRDWINNPFEHFVFVENKGQFNNVDIDVRRKICYYADSKGVDIYFSPNGLIYCHDEYISLVNEEERENMEKDGMEGRKKAVEVKRHFLQVEWEGSSSSAVIEGSGAQSFYYTYPNGKDNGRTTFKAGCFRQITYKELYPGIDVEYILPEKGGVKYSLILHPGADLSKVKMRYSGAKGLHSDSEGNIVIGTEFGDFVDHAPVSFYAHEGTSGVSEGIRSSFELVGNAVSFRLNTTASDFQPGALNPEPRTIIIDPWTTNPAFPNNKAYDVNYDQAGNVYVFGSGVGSPINYMLAKFNSAGVLQWTFTTTLGGYVLNGVTSSTTYGDFAVDEVSGSCYLFGTYAFAVKVNSIGFQVGGFMQPSYPGGFEFWRSEYNRCLKKIVLGCGAISSNFQAAMLDTSLASLTPVNIIGTTSAGHDIALLSVDPNSSFAYMAFARSVIDAANFNNAMLKLPVPALLPSNWLVPNNGHTFLEGSSVTYTPSANGAVCNGFNGMSCSPGFLYTYDGSVLKKWNKNTGAFIAQINTGGTMFASGGLSADKCDNVYAGVGNLIKVYNSSLVQIASYPVANTCYDLKLGPNNKLYACGAAFVAQMDVPSLTTPTAISTPASGCNMCNGSATALPCGNPAGYNYLWSNGAVTQTASGLCPGTYTVSITYACSDIDVVTVSVPGGVGGIILSSIQANLCSNVGSVTLTASGGAIPYTYLWSNGQTAAALTGLAAGSYTVTATDANGCTTFKAISIINTLNAIATSKYGGCSGGSNGSIALNVTGGSPGYTYAWSNGQSGVTATSLAAGTYTATVTDANGCIQTIVSILPVYYPLTIQTDQTTICTAGNNGQATVVSVSGGTSSYAYSWSNGQLSPTAINLTAGTYTVRVTDANGCTATKSVTITNGPNPANASFTQSPTGTICKGSTVNFTNTGTSALLSGHKWTIPGQGPVVSGSVTDFTYSFVNLSYTFNSVGTYTVTHSVSYPTGGCTASQSTTITVVNCTGPVVAATGSSICPGNCATVTSTNTGGSSPYTYLWSNSATTQNINPCPVSTTAYTITVTDAGGSTATSTAVVTVNVAVSATAVSTSISCSGGVNGSAQASAGGGISPYTYIWSNGVSGSMVSGLSSGTYTVTITDSKGCADITTIIINSPPPLTGQFVKGTASCTPCGCKEWLMITANGGTSPYTYTWSDGYVNRYKNQLCPGAYTINIKDKNGCSVNLNISAP